MTEVAIFTAFLLAVWMILTSGAGALFGGLAGVDLAFGEWASAGRWLLLAVLDLGLAGGGSWIIMTW